MLRTSKTPATEASSSVRLLLLLALLLPCLPGQAVVIDSGDGSGSTTAPAPDPGWHYVGRRGSLTAVYLGDGWVLTADHVGIGPVTLDGVTYDAIPSTEWQLRNADGTKADLLLFALDRYPNWPSLPIADTTPPLGTDIIMIGGGRDRGAATAWDPNGPLPPGPIGGYFWDNPSTVRWGTNEIEDIAAAPILDTWAIGSVFDESGTTHEAMAAVGDSGGGLFVDDGGTWELAGILYVISLYTNQPVNTSLYGNVTYAVDLAMYRDEIKDVTGLPEPSGALPVGALLVGALSRTRRLGE